MTRASKLPRAAAPIRVALVEDQAGLRDSLREILDGSEGITCVAACVNAEQALAELPGIKPQVVFMDINLPGMDGVSCVRQLAGVLTETLFVMLTVHDNSDAVFSSLEAGACGYLQKPVRAADLVAAARDVMAGDSPMSAKIARLVVQAFKRPVPEKLPKSAEFELTVREREVLDLLVEGFLYKEIGEKLQISDHTVHFHIRHIYSKLQVRSRAQAVAKVMKR
ncbi:response regulator transcription factor [Luteolibacter arcticus]|uniref:Response regulator transcription factor n=1 Tax=Luteolibacter arcticus TaxID=1581411 RepID=A0ABT3GQ89_9BACT|nr:response regulator transcription factor [Luteolibacter arcticus]MCW1925684.1 response regulator transcription factor [Luteolibacter arcticus]